MFEIIPNYVHAMKLVNLFSLVIMSEMYTVLMATCAVTGNVSEEWVLRCVELLLERNARVNVYDKYVECSAILVSPL